MFDAGAQAQFKKDQIMALDLENQKSLLAHCQDNDYMEFPQDPVYQEFRKNIKLRDQFLANGTDDHDRAKIWRTKRDIENDTKKKDQKRAKKEQAQIDRIKYVLLCGCLTKKQPS